MKGIKLVLQDGHKKIAAIKALRAALPLWVGLKRCKEYVEAGFVPFTSIEGVDLCELQRVLWGYKVALYLCDGERATLGWLVDPDNFWTSSSLRLTPPEGMVSRYKVRDIPTKPLTVEIQLPPQQRQDVLNHVDDCTETRLAWIDRQFEEIRFAAKCGDWTLTLTGDFLIIGNAHLEPLQRLVDSFCVPVEELIGQMEATIKDLREQLKSAMPTA